MNAPKFTPGPWQVVRTFALSGLIEKVGGEAIASVTGYYNRAGQTEPNAILIAAAPDLFNALTTLANAAESFGIPVDAARAALAKAVRS